MSSPPSHPASTPKHVDVTVIVPTLGERVVTLERTLRSIRDQHGVAAQIAIVTKHLAAGLVDISNRYSALLIHSEGHISEAVNLGIDATCERSEFMAWVGDDDLLRPGALATACEALRANPDAVACYGSCDYIDIDGRRLFTRRPPLLAPHLLKVFPGLIKQEACVFRCDAVRAVGYLDPALRYAMDLDLMLRLMKIGRFVRADRVQAAFCWHPASITVANRSKSLAEAQAIQSKHARGAARFFVWVARLPVRWLIAYASKQISHKWSRTDRDA